MADDTTQCPECGKSFATTVRICPHDGTVLEHQTTTASQLGRVLDGKYRLDAFLSQGGMGSVYRATHVMLGKTVAVKLINPELLTSPEVVRRFQREARAATALHHPNIVAVYDLGQTTDGTLYIAMEFVDGPSLKAVIARGGPVAPSRTIALLRQIASALSFAHRHNIIHRDLKPHNIMLATSENGLEVPQLVDFGIAKTFDEATQLTMTGFALGTPQYMAPEQAEGRPVDARSDLYSLGIIFYEMLTGDVPFNDPSAPAILIKHIKEMPVAPSVKNPHVVIPAELEMIVLRCLEKDPARRFQNADEFITVLEESATSIPGAAAAMEPTLLGAAMASPLPVPTPPSIAGSRSGPMSSASGASAPQGSAPTARVESPIAPSAGGGTRPTVIPAQGAVPTVAPPPPTSNALGLVAVVLFLLVAAAGAVVYLKQERAQSPVTSQSEPPTASPAMATQNPPPTSAENVTPAAATVSGSTPAPPSSAAPPPPGAAASTSRASETAPAGIAVGGASTGAASGRQGATAGADVPGAAVPGATVPGATAPATSRKGAAAATTRGQDIAGQPSAAAPIMPEHPAVFFQCAGAPEICSVLRTAVDDALDKGGFSTVRSPARAHIVVNAAAGGIQERVSQEFKTTFAVRTYAIELSGEAPHTSENVPMPTPTNVSFDPQFGSERVVEKARLVASDLVDKLKAFTQKKRGG